MPGECSGREALFCPSAHSLRMHETFVYSSTSQLLQVTFWHAYRDFFQHSKTVDPLVSASEVIRHVQIAFPGAMAKAYTDEQGQSRFVIAGMGFRKGSGESRLLCGVSRPITPS